MQFQSLVKLYTLKQWIFAAHDLTMRALSASVVAPQNLFIMYLALPHRNHSILAFSYTTEQVLYPIATKDSKLAIIPNIIDTTLKSMP